MSKCRVCRGPAVIDLPRHNANFCAEHFQQLCRRQVAKAIDDHDMLQPDDRVLVAVSAAARTRLAVWDLLLELGYDADGLYIGLGIGDYSDDQRRLRAGVRRRARPDADRDRPARRRTATTCRRRRGRRAGCRARRAGCRSATCSTRPRSTAATTSSSPATTSTTRRRCCSATRCAGTSTTSPASSRCCRRGDGFPRKVKPLVRLTERETAAWCVVRGIDYLVEECPMAAGNRHLGYKAALNALEAQSPGTKAAFYLGFLEQMAPLLAGAVARRRRRARRVRAVRRADDRRGVRVLPARRDGVGARAGARRAVSTRRAVGVDEPSRCAVGERVLLLDAKRRRYLVTLAEGGEFHSHAGFVAPRRPRRPARGRRRALDEGRRVHRAAPDARGLRLEMPRGAQVIYPKDLAPICMLADIGPGVRVFETGVGSGALSMTMLRWGADDRRLRAPRGLRQPGPGQRAQLPRRGRARAATASSSATATRASTSATVRPGRARPARAVAGRAARRAGAAPGRDPRRLHAVDHPGGAGPRGARRAVDRRPHARGAPPRLAHRGPGGAPRPPHGRPHRLPHRRRGSSAGRVT